jgi:acyl transferase domain-containing protein/NAD(P)H-dependent flavin oxidoreductase YrpB (nitropropane dioxygenase family)/NAD(P)-dependent dehydrogenase (short-subunit alcohol dehydrogenase family)/acyl carrier protein
MMAEARVPIIAFVWRPEETGPPVIQMAHRTGSRAIFDFSAMGAEALHSFLQRTNSASHISDIKISAATLMDPSLGRSLNNVGVQDIWVECQPPFSQGDLSAFLQRLRDLSENHRCFPIIGDLDLLTAILKESSGIGRIVLKGCEASRFVSGETALVLYSAAREMLRAGSKSMDILIWGGVWTPEAAAAFLSTGATGIVFESVHWLTDLVAIDDLQRQQLANLRMDSTDLAGLDLKVPCRLFNKGNSLAFKEIKTLEDSLCAAEITDESRRSFVGQVQARALHPLKSHFTQDEVIPLGVEAAFAASFAERFGTGTEKAVRAFMEEIRNSCRSAEAKKDCFLDSPVAREMGIKYPFIQGAMSSITDVPEFALRVAEAGGLPTIALGLMDAEACDRKLGRLPEIMGGRPYAVNVVSLAENPFRETHLAWIKQHRPRFVWIAGGDLSPIRELLECRIEVAYIAPDGDLLRLALEAGVRYVVCEGYEAGGHVGQHSTLTLAQMVLDLKRRKPSLFQDCRVILAGGIFNRETAFMAALLGADAIQMGTAYLATREIVETGALTALYRRMIVESPPGRTVVSGQGTGLRVRSLRTPRVAAALSLEREFAAGHQDERSFRTRMEEMTAGSLFAAARGVDRPSGMLLDEQACLERGQFMSGACGGLISKVQKLQAFHREMAEGPLLLHQPFEEEIGNIPVTSPSAPPHIETPIPGVGYGRKRVAPHKDGYERIAITGMSILNALGKSPEEIWAASLAMKSGITLVPPSRWDHGCYYDPRPRVSDKTYCKVGAFLDFQISRNELGIPPQDFRTMTAATKSTLWLADRAIRASGILESNIPRERIGVLISQNSGEAAGTLTNIIIRAYVHDVLAAVKRAVDLTPDQVSAIEQEVKAGRMAPDDTTLLGRLNCAAAGFICNRYGFMGPSYSVSAACATSLVALHSAMQMIRNGIIDAAIVGGAEDNLTHLHFLEFSALGALFGLSGRERPAHETSRPFDAERDGMVLGEGGGMIVIERESLARARGARVHSIITSMGASNNHLGMVESSSVTQEIAILASFRGLPYGPDAVDLVECHATSTRQGDVEEVRALKTFFKPSKRTVLTSFKSQIGHTLGASGINNIIRGTMAMKTGVFPATLNYEHPDPEMGLEGSGLLIAPEPLDWKTSQPRRLQVNAFGFGGSNFVVQLEQALDEADTILVSPDRASSLAGEKDGGPPAIRGISFFRTELDGRYCRMAVVAQSDKEALTVIGRSAALAEARIVSPKMLRSLAQQGIFVSPEDLPAPPLAFVFPGQGAHYGGMGRNLYESFPVIKEWMDRTAAAADFDLLHLLFHDREENLQKTRWQQPALFALEHAMARYLITLDIRPMAMAGHSLGELIALCLAGVYSVEDGFRIVNKRALCMDKAAAMHGDPGVMAATDAPLDLLKEMIQGLKDVHIGNINSPNQVILSGNTEAVKNLGGRLKEKGYRFTLLRVSMAFHSPIMRVIHDELEAFVASIPFHSPQIPVISNTTMAPYPSDPGEIRRILMAHLESPVHWMNNVQTLWNDYGIRLFVEVGPGDILSDLIAGTLPESACIQTCIPPAEGITYTTALAELFVQGHLKVQGEPGWVSLPASRKPPESHPIAPASTVRPSEHRGSGVFEGQKQVSPGKPVSAPLDPASAIMGTVSPAIDEAPVHPKLMERLIRIIMDATGFERDEIKPEMDLRKDLSVRSSRLPIIMDAAERQFGITIELEEFMDARTVKDIAQRISGVIARQPGGDLPPASKTVDRRPVQDEMLKPPEDEESVKRLVFSRVPMKLPASIPMELSPGESVLLLSPDRDDAIAGRAGEILRRDYGVDTIPMRFMQSALGPGEEGHDILTDEGSGRAAERILGLASLAGMVITLPQGGSGRVKGMADVAQLLRGLFLPLKAFLQSPKKKFVVLIHSREDPEALGRLLTEGMLGLFLSAAQEYSSVQFRMLEIEQDTDLRIALRGALDRGYTAVEIMHHDGSFFTSEGHVAPSVFGDMSSMILSPGDVVVMSGGATGISAHLARSLVPFMPRLVLLGRTSLDPGIALARPRPGHLPSEAFAADPRASEIAQGEDVFPPAFLKAFTADLKASEIARTLADLRASGIEATYHTCDVTDPDAVHAVMGEVASRYGRIDGIIHGAGVLRDGLLSQMTPDDLSTVADVKFLGAWNLFSAAERAGLRFFVGLSSVAAIQGNPGQTNYAAANRMMSALLRYLHRRNGAIRFKALMLPPVEGAGMAEDPDVREMMRRKGAAYLHVNEIAELFCRELSAAPADDDWVMFMRRLPSVRTARLNDTIQPALNGDLNGGGMAFRAAEFPMIEELSCLDIRRGQLAASRAFSQEKDLWIADHRPFTFVKHPLVSAAMVVETFMEAARMLYPHLHVRGVRQVRLMDMIQCPPALPRPSIISCRRAGNGLREVLCEVSLSTQDISPAGKLTGGFIPHCKGQVILDGGRGDLGEGFKDFPVRPDELRTGPMDHKQVLKWYKNHSGLEGRYRVIDLLDGAGPGVVRGRTIYRETSDFANLENARYQYSPYLLEALLQVVIFYIAAIDPSERRSMIPTEIGEMRFLRPCRAGEQVTLEARMRVQNEKGFAWDARGLDDQGHAIMQVHNMRMHWVLD